MEINQIIINLTGTARLTITLLFVVALLVFVWGMVKLIFAAGNPQGIKDAKSILWWGIIGLTVLASASGIVFAIQAYFGVGPSPIPNPQFGGSGGAGSSSGQGSFGGNGGSSLQIPR